MTTDTLRKDTLSKAGVENSPEDLCENNFSQKKHLQDLVRAATPLTSGQFFLKRSTDLIGGIIALTVLLILLPLVAVAIKMDSRGPVFFKQPRVGKDGRLFYMYKFRSMCNEAESRLKGLIAKEETDKGTIFKTSVDPRVTKVGQFLRRTSIDELPQIINVVKGEMSLVGPRALLPMMTEPYPELNAARSLVMPGITGLWQVKARHLNTSMLDMIEFDLRYIVHYSFVRDVQLLVVTPFSIWKGQGAH